MAQLARAAGVTGLMAEEDAVSGTNTTAESESTGDEVCSHDLKAQNRIASTTLLSVRVWMCVCECVCVSGGPCASV